MASSASKYIYAALIAITLSWLPEPSLVYAAKPTTTKASDKKAGSGEKVLAPKQTAANKKKISPKNAVAGHKAPPTKQITTDKKNAGELKTTAPIKKSKKSLSTEEKEIVEHLDLLLMLELLKDYTLFEEEPK